MPADTAAVVKGAAEGGDYASTSEVFREALRDETSKRAIRRREQETLKAEIDKGLADLAAGHVNDLDADRISNRCSAAH